jgi:hypothetical protein
MRFGWRWGMGSHQVVRVGRDQGSGLRFMGGAARRPRSGIRRRQKGGGVSSDNAGRCRWLLVSEPGGWRRQSVGNQQVQGKKRRRLTQCRMR